MVIKITGMVFWEQLFIIYFVFIVIAYKLVQLHSYENLYRLEVLRSFYK